MSLPNHLAKIKSAGVYRFVWDKSVIPPQQAETLRLLVGYSEKGPFNAPVYIESFSDFKSIYGNISKKLERKGAYFHRMAEQALQAGPILALNIKPFMDEDLIEKDDQGKDKVTKVAEKVTYANFNGTNIMADETNENYDLAKVLVKNIYDSNRFWNLDADKMLENIAATSSAKKDKYITLAVTDTKESSCTVVMRPIHNKSYEGITLRSWCVAQGIEPTGYMEHILDVELSSLFADIYVFRGEFTPAVQGGVLSKYFNEDGTIKAVVANSMKKNVDGLATLASESASNFVGAYSGCLLPYFKDANGNYISLDIRFNADHAKHKMLMKMNGDLLDSAEANDIILEYLGATETSLAGPTFYTPIYFEGYTYNSIDIKGDTLWEQCKCVLEEPGIYEALTNRVDVEYHYIIDTFDTGINEYKKELFSIAKDKDNAFAIINFPKISKWGKIEGGADEYGKNMPGESEGASWGAYYTQLVFTDGTVKSVIPSAALVSNNFMQKWGPRQPYYIVAGPNYGVLNYSGLVGPDYNFGRSDLDILEPMGVNAIIYVPRLGTYISSNQTAKQVPVSGLSKVHIRELVIYLQNEIEHLLQSYQWELNTQPLRDTIKAKADAICETIQNNGGIYAFMNICDETNNTSEVIDNEMIVLDTEIEPARGAGKMVHQLTIHKTGGLTSSIK